MQRALQHFSPIPYASLATYQPDYEPAPIIACNWQALRAQLLLQWEQLTARELDKAGPNRHRLALLIESKYGVAAQMIENYLRNFERTMPLTGHS
jgi:hypothetical protein